MPRSLRTELECLCCSIVGGHPSGRWNYPNRTCRLTFFVDFSKQYHSSQGFSILFSFGIRVSALRCAVPSFCVWAFGEGKSLCVHTALRAHSVVLRLQKTYIFFHSASFRRQFASQPPANSVAWFPAASHRFKISRSSDHYCLGSKKLRLLNQLTNLWHRDRLRSDMIFGYDMFDAVIASALKKLLNTQSLFRKRVSVEEQNAQEHDRFLRGRQIAYTIYERFRATGVRGAVQGLWTLFASSLQTDDVQDFLRKMPSGMILEELYKSTF